MTRFDHRAALRAVRDHAGYSEDERRVLYAMILLADEHGASTADERTIAMCVDVLADIEASGTDPIAAIEQARAALARGAK